MEISVKIIKTLRNNWKKSIFFSCVSVYAIRYTKRKIDDNVTRKVYCEAANKYGHEYISLIQKPKRATVFLNPAASEGSGRKLFEKNAAPILFLSGIEINLVKTEYEGQAKEFMTVMEPSDTDLIVVAGGDGLLAEVVGGIMKKSDQKFERSIPIAVIPVGKTNRFFRSLFGESTDIVKSIGDAAMAVLNGQHTRVDVMEIMGSDGKQTFALSGLEFGSYRDAIARKNKYWYFGPLKSRWTHIRTCMKQWPPSTTAHISYIPSDVAERVRLDAGEMPQNTTVKSSSNASTEQHRKSWSWRDLFYRRAKHHQDTNEEQDLMYVGDEHYTEEDVSTVEFTVMSSNYRDKQDSNRSMDVSIGPSDPTRTDYLNDGIQRLKNKSLHMGGDGNKHISVERIKFIPQVQENEEAWYSIDGEQYEAKPINISLLRNRLTFIQPRLDGNVT